MNGKSKGFVQVPIDVVNAQDITTLEKMVLISLISYDFHDKAGRQKKIVWPSMERIGKNIGLSRKTVWEAIKNLAKMGYIEIESRRGQSSRYHFLDKATVTCVADTQVKS